MGNEKRIKIICPECQSEIIVDSLSFKILYHEPKNDDEGSPKKKSIQELLKEMAEQREKTAARFEEEKEALKHRSEYLENKFEEIKKHVDTNDKTPPPHPFDYD
ncbi:MAG: hypothetical protein CO150_05805 [Nitrospirae bacterium CG_4_9_14_3_um_filter_53_35]|nr:MAG: hypothetical protein AUK29_04320 [Nitrospirae bacterium CG2_30_53_67]PIS38059.1 MAG: hypothetical protein COT35_02605 [Nitrospirae bacterium CG08_land_8_20_14_0_20_52_24]PIV85677.1 MAG: hypothetical protein COW52_00825 [Nitrospirae bacterium CG17_big_fil_post_rev_8_21_14_2_50_50_9]PIW85426.1 MAG: hypothetical protein COZ95_04565 [Nitrospirae bacterium CG_4_8_14_3_um_filter_50_41]PIX86206.1 MAG: hypothetical protein COZ32_04510 [Nitrospirae bacterium CG_4_10_14_3_um_filter_53_41]PJA7479